MCQSATVYAELLCNSHFVNVFVPKAYSRGNVYRVCMRTCWYALCGVPIGPKRRHVYSRLVLSENKSLFWLSRIHRDLVFIFP